MTGGLDFEVLAHAECALGTVCLRRRATATELTLDHQFLMSSEVTVSERALALRALEMHGGSELCVLVGGLGLGYTARAVLTPCVARVEVVELLPPVIEWLERGLIPLAGELRADGRLVVRQGDVYRELRSAPRRTHDVILVDVDHSPDRRLGEESAHFYGERGLALAKRHLEPGGVLGVWSVCESPELERALRRVFREVEIQPVTFENRVLGGEETNWLFLARA